MALAEAPTLEELLGAAEVEDIVLKPRGIAYFAGGEWRGPCETAEMNRGLLQNLARQIAEEAGITLGLTQPTVDAFFSYRSGECFRAHVAIPPLVLEGPEITLRRLPRMHRLFLSDFEMSPAQHAELVQAVQNGDSLLVAGVTGSGKTSLLTALMSLLPPNCRVLILEDSPELPLPNPLSTKLLCRSNRFGFRSGAIWHLGDLVFESLRMRPDRLILGECRGPEALAIATALQTGHSGLMTTLHAGSCEQALERFEQLAQKQAGEGQRNYRKLWKKVVFVELDERSGRRCVRKILSADLPNG